MKILPIQQFLPKINLAPIARNGGSLAPLEKDCVSFKGGTTDYDMLIGVVESDIKKEIKRFNKSKAAVADLENKEDKTPEEMVNLSIHATRVALHEPQMKIYGVDLEKLKLQKQLQDEKDDSKKEFLIAQINAFEIEREKYCQQGDIVHFRCFPQSAAIGNCAFDIEEINSEKDEILAKPELSTEDKAKLAEAEQKIEYANLCIKKAWATLQAGIVSSKISGSISETEKDALLDEFTDRIREEVEWKDIVEKHPQAILKKQAEEAKEASRELTIRERLEKALETDEAKNMHHSKYAFSQFHEVDEGYFWGTTLNWCSDNEDGTKKDKDIDLVIAYKRLETLAAKGIKTIVNVDAYNPIEHAAVDYYNSQQSFESERIAYEPLPIKNQAHLSSDDTIEEFLGIVCSPQSRPVYVCCSNATIKSKEIKSIYLEKIAKR